MLKEIWKIDPWRKLTEGEDEEVLSPNTILWGRDVYPVDDTEGTDADADAEKLTWMTRRLEDANAHGKVSA